MTDKYKWLQSVKSKVKRVGMPELIIGMDRNLWGLTLWIWSYCLQMAERNLRKNAIENNKTDENTKTEDKPKEEGNLTENAIVTLSQLTNHIRRF